MATNSKLPLVKTKENKKTNKKYVMPFRGLGT